MRWAAAAVAAGAWLSAVAAPADNLSSAYENFVWPYQSDLGQTAFGVTLGIGNGYSDFRSEGVVDNAVVQTAVGVPIAGVSANRFLGEKLEPPSNWNGEEPTIVEGTGGGAVWIDFAHEVITTEAGPIEIQWPVGEVGGGETTVERSVVAASPNKRPVRLYWTHKRPIYASDTPKLLQNAGPTVSFGQNYKVHIYPTSRIKLFNPDGGEDPDPSQGYIYLDGTELGAFEGTYGTFLIAYSRLDEAVNERKLLAYELVNVLEPTQTKLEVKIGDQLKPLTRDFNTDELFPRITRGLTDDANNGEIYVYQHASGAQKNFIWAIRDTHDNPWKIEVFWRAKEELDVVWPFEVDIYDATWNKEGAQLYVRDCVSPEGGAAKTEPVVYFPSGLTVEAMDYQVVSDGNGGYKQQTHMQIESAAFYTDWADSDTFALLRYTSGEQIWFQTVRSIPARNETIMKGAGLDYWGVVTNYWNASAEKPEYHEFYSWELKPTDVPLAKEIRAPFAGDDGFFYPGWIYKDHVASDDAYPVKNPYNPSVYAYPTEYVKTNELYSPIFPVNMGELEVWWSLPSNLNGTPRANGGQTEPLATQMFFPALPLTYTVYTPQDIEVMASYGDAVVEPSPQIVVASGKGSMGYSLPDYYTYAGTQIGAIIHVGMYLRDIESHTTLCPTGLVTRLHGTGNSVGETDAFTFEFFGSGIYTDDMIPIISFYGTDSSDAALPDAKLKLATDSKGNLYMNGTNMTKFAEFPEEYMAFFAYQDGFPRQAGLGGTHWAVAFSDKTCKYYLNNHLAKIIELPDAVMLDVSKDVANLFESYQAETYIPDKGYYERRLVCYQGEVNYIRLWSVCRSQQQIDETRYLKAEASSSLVFQYSREGQSFEKENEDSVMGPLYGNRLIDSSGHEAHAYLGFDPYTIEPYDGEYEDPNPIARYWFQVGRSGFGGMVLPGIGRTFPADALIYQQNNPDLDGYNPNEEHAFMEGGIAYALRTDLNQTDKYDTSHKFTSLPYVLVQYNDADTGKVKMEALWVVPENDMYRFRSYKVAGSMFQSPPPLRSLQPANLHTFLSGPLYGNLTTCFKDRKDWYWAHQAGNDGGATNYVFEFSYPNQEAFDWPEGASHGDTIPWMGEYVQRDDYYLFEKANGFGPGENVFTPRDTSKDPTGTGIDYTFTVTWGDNVPELYVLDTLHTAKKGGPGDLPSVRGQLSCKVIYQQSLANGGDKAVQLIDPEIVRGGSLPVLPDTVRTYKNTRTAKRQFTDMPPYLHDRFVWNPTAFYDRTHGDTREIELGGKYINDATAGFQYVWLNVLDPRSKQMLSDEDIFPGGSETRWQAGLDTLATDPYLAEDENFAYQALALTTTGKGVGYVTLVMNNATDINIVPKSESIYMYVIKVVPELAHSKLHVIESENPLDKQVNMKVTLDFGGHPELWDFEWQYCNPVNGKAASIDDTSAWKSLGTDCGKPGMTLLDWVAIGDAGSFGLADHYVRCHYRPKDPSIVALVGSGWSDWSDAQLAEGWIKRVLKKINPFDQKLRDLLNNKVDSSISMIQQAGRPYEGDIPLNMDALSDNGLIQIYQTVLNQAKKLSINDNEVATESLALALQMAAGRIAELYTVLGNEAYADALNPTVDLGSNSGIDDTAESSIFPFMNQCENLLEEELCLLRGRDVSDDYMRSWRGEGEPWSTPTYNRLLWNFTSDIMGGQVAYVENYGIRDMCSASDATDPTAKDGIIDAYDAATLYPQGHGDAWGHYLSAIKGYYALLKHPNFGWKPQIEGILIGQEAVTISYLHEKRFAQVAEAKAKVAEKIVADTYRWNYVAGEEDPWMQAEDDVTWEGDGKTFSRAWGTDEWATRGHLGAYYDWLMANALLPARESELGQIRMLDRESTKELTEIAACAKRIQSTADYADVGLNPLGISDSAIPFDISPSEIDEGKMHFEQIYERAIKATQVAKEIFNRVKGVSNKLRDQNASADYENMIDDEEAAIERELIEVYGYPYADDIGVGKTYPQGYDGPDIYHYYYVETYDLDGSGGINGAYRDVKAGDGSYGRYIDVPVDNFTLITTNLTGVYQAELDESLADNGFVGNIIVGAVSWYQQTLAQVGSYIDPWSKYTGICSTNYTLPVAVVDTTGDYQDGKVDYSFYVAAWSNDPWVASYYVGAEGFTPKPSDFHGQRRAEGECQIALSSYAALLAEIDVKANALMAANAKLQGLIDELTALDYSTQMGYVTDAAQQEVERYIASCKKNAETVETVLKAAKELAEKISESGVEAFPKITGISFDMTSIARAALKAIQAAGSDLLNGQLQIQQQKVDACEEALEDLSATVASQCEAWMSNADRQKKIAGIKEQIGNVKAALAELEISFNNANDTRMNYAKLVARGEELQAERERLRIQWAADLSQSRYRNMMCQILRNDELTRYNQAFEQAAKYVFLAAKAYDYETGLLQSDSNNAAGRAFMSQIIKSRALGRFTADGQPLGGGSEGDPGLSDILFRMHENWLVLKGRLGFNNAQNDLDSFSLRKDLYGKTDDAEGDKAWRQALADCWVDDLRTHPTFAQYCQPFDPMQAVEPGFAIPFRTTIAARKDLFGNSLAGGSTAYSSTYFATKLRAVGVWIEGANAKSALPTRPEVYLVPSGLDYMRVPVKASTSKSVATRTWSVVDQVLPMPYALSDTDWDATDWSMLKDVFSNELCVQRRHPAIRANVGATFDESATMTYNSRLIGRSVWNDQWYIFVPAASLNDDNATAKENFLSTVKDIHLNLKTYSFSGN